MGESWKAPERCGLLPMIRRPNDGASIASRKSRCHPERSEGSTFLGLWPATEEERLDPLMTDAVFDVAIIGGGPAGAAAARLLAGWGHATTLITRGSPRHPLAESLPPSCVKLFDRLGVRAAVDAADFVRATGNTVIWGAPANDERTEYFADGVLGYQVRRDAFDQVLLDAARVAGAD